MQMNRVASAKVSANARAGGKRFARRTTLRRKPGAHIALVRHIHAIKYAAESCAPEVFAQATMGELMKIDTQLHDVFAMHPLA